MAPGPSSKLWKTLDSYKLSTGDQYTAEEQVIFHNEGFAEYFVDFTFDLQRFETVIGAQLAHVSHLSLYLHSNQDEFVGFARTAIRGRRAWVAGLAIVPAFRSKRIGSLLLREYLNLLRETSNVRLVQLEVVKENARAAKLYSRLGFQANFDLRDYVIEDAQALFKTTEEMGLTVSTSEELDLTLPWLQHRTIYSWQREFSTLLNSCRGMKQHVVKDHKDQFVVALAIEMAPDPVRIMGFAFESGALTSQRLAGAIRAVVGDTSKGAEVHLEPDSSEVNALLDEMPGCKRDTSLEEHHMILDLERPGGS